MSDDLPDIMVSHSADPREDKRCGKVVPPFRANCMRDIGHKGKCDPFKPVAAGVPVVVLRTEGKSDG